MELVDDFHQAGLVGHHLGDRLVGVGVFVNELLGHAVVRPTRHGAAERFGAQLAERSLATEPTAGTMRAGLVRHLTALPAHDERRRSH
jgi:hypothetical protein